MAWGVGPPEVASWNVGLEKGWPQYFCGMRGWVVQNKEQPSSLPHEIGVCWPAWPRLAKLLWAALATEYDFPAKSPLGLSLPNAYTRKSKLSCCLAFEIICLYLVVLGFWALWYPQDIKKTETTCCSVILKVSRSLSSPLSTSKSNFMIFCWIISRAFSFILKQGTKESELMAHYLGTTSLSWYDQRSWQRSWSSVWSWRTAVEAVGGITGKGLVIWKSA